MRKLRNPNSIYLRAIKYYGSTYESSASIVDSGGLHEFAMETAASLRKFGEVNAISSVYLREKSAELSVTFVSPVKATVRETPLYTRVSFVSCFGSKVTSVRIQSFQERL